MKQRKENVLVDWTDDIILLNDNYADKGLYAGYIGVVVENLIQEKGIILADFYHPLTGEDIAILVEIKKEDFQVYSETHEDQKLGKAFKDLFRK